MPQPAEQEQRAVARIGEVRCRIAVVANALDRGEWQPYVLTEQRHRAREIARSDPDYYERLAVDANERAQDVRIGAVAHPKVIAHDGRRRLVAALLRRREGAPQSRLDAKRVEIAGGHECSLRAPRDVTFIDTRLADGMRCKD